MNVIDGENFPDSDSEYNRNSVDSDSEINNREETVTKYLDKNENDESIEITQMIEGFEWKKIQNFDKVNILIFTANSE